MVVRQVESSKERVLLVGAGRMGRAYCSVLKALGRDFFVVGNSLDGVQEFQAETGCNAAAGGLKSFLENTEHKFKIGIVSTPVERLADHASQLIDHGVEKLLVEKPAGLSAAEVEVLDVLAREKNIEIIVGYNRRCFSSVLTAKKMIDEDGGVISFDFEISERSHLIEDSSFHPSVKAKWLVANSSHVIETAFFIGGRPTDYRFYQTGELKWHPSASIFYGAGQTNSGALFSYRGNWSAPGRWSLDVNTANRRFIFCPFEELHILQKGETTAKKMELDNKHDEDFKPGLFLQTRQFLDGETGSMCSISEQLEMMQLYSEMAGYVE